MESLNEFIPNAKPLFELCHTILEAAGHGARRADALPEMRALVLEGIQQVSQRAQTRWPDGMEPSRQEREALAGQLRNCDSKSIQPLAAKWFNSFCTALMRIFAAQMPHTTQLTGELCRDAKAILESLPMDGTTRGRLLLQLGMKCEVWDPQLSWEYIMQAFDTVPDLLAEGGDDYLKGYVYRPGAHPQTEITACPICGGKGTPFHAACSCLINSFDPMFLPGKLWMRCGQCGNLYSKYFPTEFLQMGSVPKVLQPDPTVMKVREVSSSSLRIWCDILNRIRNYTSGNTLLEVGVGQGHLIAVAQEMGYEVTAVEILESEARQTADLLGLPVICGDFLHLEENLKVDIITMGDVIEHLQRPVDGLKKAHRLLKDGGILWLSTPNFESAFSRMTKVDDPMWREPYHITYFSRSGLLKQLEWVGFQLLDYRVSNRYNGSMELLLNKV